MLIGLTMIVNAKGNNIFNLNGIYHMVLQTIQRNYF